jgi:hypothetical protein
MGDGRIFSKNLRASLINDDLSNESNFGRIHLAAGQYGTFNGILLVGVTPRSVGCSIALKVAA